MDLDQHTITVRQTSNYLPGKGVYVSTTKTASSARPLLISTAAVMMLLEYQHWQDEQRRKLGDAWEDQDGRSHIPRQRDAMVQQIHCPIWDAEGHRP